MIDAREPLAAALRLRSAIRARAAEIEATRRIPGDLNEELSRAGCHRLFAPAWSAGKKPCYGDALRVIEGLAAADGSVGWVVSQYALGQIIVGHLPRPALDEIYRGGPDVRIAGVFAPKGRTSRTDSGWQVAGRWSFASGCEAASWIYVQCLVVKNRRVVLTAGEVPVTRLAVLPAGDVEIIDTWDAVGLRGTGSHDIEIRSRTCADDWTCLLADADGEGEDIQSVPLIKHAGLLVAAVATGIAAGALENAAELAASGKRPTFSTSILADDPIFQDRLGEAHMKLRAARALLHTQARLVESAMDGAVLPPVDRASLRATCHHVSAMAVEAVDVAYTLGRSSSIGHASPLQRQLRDIHTLTQHAWNSRDATRHLGATLSGGQ